MEESQGYVPDEMFYHGPPRSGDESRVYTPPAAFSLVLARTTEDEATIRAHRIVAAYIGACPRFSGLSQINEWRIVCRINPTDTYELSLKGIPCSENCQVNSTYIQLAPGPSIMRNGRLDGMARTLKISVRGGSTIGDLLDEIWEKNLNQYQLRRGRGHRFWLYHILQVATTTFHAPDENLNGMTTICQGWDNEFPIIPGEYQTPVQGIWLDHSAWS